MIVTKLAKSAVRESMNVRISIVNIVYGIIYTLKRSNRTVNAVSATNINISNSIKTTCFLFLYSDGGVKGDFEFVINDRITYYTLPDFKSSNAQSIFSQALGLSKQFEELKADLSSKRDQFANSSSTDSNLRAAILNLEKQADDLYKEIERLKIQARNDEIRNNFN
jgi:hypothetical protein